MKTTTDSGQAIWERMKQNIARRWFPILSLVFGLYVGLPLLAPVLMQIGWSDPGRVIYFIYSFLCHQLPQRSYFLFGPKLTYSLAEVQSAWQNTIDPLILRQFIGNSTLGWKVAWSDRMVSLYGGLWLFAVVWSPLCRRVKPLPWWGFVLLALPMVLDGGTHLVSDFAGIGQGFRDSNVWLAALTGNVLPVTFYAGDAFGSFNSWTRIVTGLLFGLGVAWFVFPHLQRMFAEMVYNLEVKLKGSRNSR